MRVLKGRKYLALLLTLVVLIVLFPILRATPQARILLDIAFSFVFVAAWLAVLQDAKLRIVAIVLGTPTLLGLWTGYLVPGLPRIGMQIGFHTLAALFFVFMIFVILREVYREEGVSADSVYGAFCGYLLAGLAFGHVYTILEILEPGSFRGSVPFADEMPDARRHFLLTYFSFITLATVGYGDILPATDTARGLVIVQAIIGQFYIAVLVAELIGKRVSMAVANRHTHKTSDGN